MNFQESVEYLFNLGYELSVKKFGLENTFTLLEALNNPEKNFLKIQVAGTNGKGSTCAFLEAICVAANINVGLYTSPHLISITERIKINGAEISEKDFALHAAIVKETSEKLVEKGELETVPTFFEQVTAIALNKFAEEKVELVILETGIGGRFDATTATNAEIAAITPVDFDHQDILGNSIAEIAAEKAAIIQKDSKVVTASQLGEAKDLISRRCEEFQITPSDNCKVEINAGGVASDRIIATFITENEIYRDAHLGLRGRHQIENARVAVMLAEVLRNDFNYKIAGFEVVEGLENAKHKGRLEFCENILFDGAHNVAGAKALRDYFDEFIKQPITLVFGAMKDKDLAQIAEILFPKAEHVIFTKPDNSRSMETRDLIEFLPNGFDVDKVFQSQTVKEALKIAQKISANKNLICVTGSLYLVGEAQKLLNNKSEI